jgi:hypothetical protein
MNLFQEYRVLCYNNGPTMPLTTITTTIMSRRTTSRTYNNAFYSNTPYSNTVLLNMKVVFEHLWGLWKDLKDIKTSHLSGDSESVECSFTHKNHG